MLDLAGDAGLARCLRGELQLMARITIIGSGVMGTSIAVPALDNGHEVTLVGSPSR